MTTAVERMYKKAGRLYCNKCRHDSELDCIYLCENKHPEFTAEKQIKIIKALEELSIDTRSDIWKLYKFGRYYPMPSTFRIENEDLGEALALMVIKVWKYFDKEKKKEIMDIIE